MLELQRSVRSVVKSKFHPSPKQWVALVMAWGLLAVLVVPSLVSL
jgi:hypothetical protein